MKRIILLVIRLFYRIPGWLMRISYYNKHMDDTTFAERHDFIRRLIMKVNSKSRVKIHSFGIENLPEEQGYLMAPNHQGLFDPLVLFETNEQPFKIIVKKELMKTMFLGDILRMLEAPAMDRSNLRGSMKIIKQATKDMENGINYCIFPEGTRTKNKNKLLEFKPGTFKSVVDAKKPIVPIALIDCYKIFAENTARKEDVQIHYLKPLYYEDYKDMNTTEIAHKVQSIIQECIDENEFKYAKD